MRATSIATIAAAVLLLLASLADAGASAPRRQLQQVSAARCRALFPGGGGIDRVVTRLPSCRPGASYDEDTCCSQVKRAVRAFPTAGQCLCVDEVWAEMKREASSSGLPNVSGKRLAKFLDTCNIPYAGGSGC